VERADFGVGGGGGNSTSDGGGNSAPSSDFAPRAASTVLAFGERPASAFPQIVMC